MDAIFIIVIAVLILYWSVVSLVKNLEEDKKTQRELKKAKTDISKMKNDYNKLEIEHKEEILRLQQILRRKSRRRDEGIRNVKNDQRQTLTQRQTIEERKKELTRNPQRVSTAGDTVHSIPPAKQPKHHAQTTISADKTTEIEVIPEYKKVLSLVDDTLRSVVFVTGGAGTGKSTLIRYLKSVSKKQIAIVAPTGVAALNACGVTIHSLFRLPPRIIQATDVKEVYDRQLYTKIELLIIDEVSMVRPDVLDAVDLFLRINRDSNDAFGGVKILLLGDLFQLPPVVSNAEQLMLRRMEYNTEFFFSAYSIAEGPLAPIFLNRAFRQRDACFISLLNDLREGKNLEQVLNTINTRCGAPSSGDHEMILTCKNSDADERNRNALERLTGSKGTYTGSITGEFDVGRSKLPSPRNLVLKSGAQVMFTKNDDNKRWVNGTIGRVIRLKQRTVEVEVVRDSIIQTLEVEPVTWEYYRYEFDDVEERIVAKVIGRYTQIPLMLAWAVTIHKAQGKTIDRIYVDLGNRAFAAGQVYVALSRVRSIDDIRLARPIRKDDVQPNHNVRRFYEQLLSVDSVPGSLETR